MTALLENLTVTDPSSQELHEFLHGDTMRCLLIKVSLLLNITALSHKEV